MTDEVAALVLRNNYLQTLALSLAERRGVDDLGFQQRLMQTLEARGLLDRAVEFLPDDVELGERAQARRGADAARARGAARLCQARRSTPTCSTPRCRTIPISAASSAAISRRDRASASPMRSQGHRLRREIIATQLANSMINRGGPALVGAHRRPDRRRRAARIAAAFAAVRDSFGMTALNAAIDALDNAIGGKLQLALYADRAGPAARSPGLVHPQCRPAAQGLATIVEHYRGGIAAREAALDGALPGEATAARDARAAKLGGAGVPDDLARRIADLPVLAAAPDVVLVADRTGKPVAEVAATYFAVGAYFKVDRIVDAARDIKASDYFDRLALDRALDSIGEAERRLTAADGDRRRLGRRRSRSGSRRRRRKSSASARRWTRSPAPASPSPSSPLRRACWGIW